MRFAAEPSAAGETNRAARSPRSPMTCAATGEGSREAGELGLHRSSAPKTTVRRDNLQVRKMHRSTSAGFARRPIAGERQQICSGEPKRPTRRGNSRACIGRGPTRVLLQVARKASQTRIGESIRQNLTSRPVIRLGSQASLARGNREPPACRKAIIASALLARWNWIPQRRGTCPAAGHVIECEGGRSCGKDTTCRAWRDGERGR